MDYFNEFWLGYITAEFIRRCVNESLVKCHGCRDGKISPLLHTHHQHGLKDKVVFYMEMVRGLMIPLIPSLYEEFKLKVGGSIMDKDAYVTNARFFLISATPESLYYGRFINETNDSFIHSQPIREPITEPSRKRTIKGSKKQKKVISNNDVIGSVAPQSSEEKPP